MDKATFEKWDTWELLSIPMLDTSFARAERLQVREVLKSRGVFGRRKWKLQAIAYAGLWWNVFAGVWFGLGIEHIVDGWALNIGVLGGIAAGTSLYETLLHFTLLDDVLSVFISIPAGLIFATFIRRAIKPRLLVAVRRCP